MVDGLWSVVVIAPGYLWTGWERIGYRDFLWVDRLGSAVLIRICTFERAGERSRYIDRVRVNGLWSVVIIATVY